MNASSTVYFLQENMYGLFELQFGDGIICAQPQAGNVIVISYRVCNTSAPNGCKIFAPLDAIDGVALITVGLNTPATNGSDKESIEFDPFQCPSNL